MSSRLCNEYPRKACASHDPGASIGRPTLARPASPPDRILRQDVIDSSRLQPIYLTVARDRAADRGCTGSCDGAEDVGPPGEIRGGFSFELRRQRLVKPM